MSKDLFGDDTQEPQRKLVGKYEVYRARYHYRKGTDMQCCNRCFNHSIYEYNGKYYHKCNLQGYSMSTNSDIRLKNVCDNFKVDKIKKGV